MSVFATLAIQEAATAAVLIMMSVILVYITVIKKPSVQTPTEVSAAFVNTVCMETEPHVLIMHVPLGTITVMPMPSVQKLRKVSVVLVSEAIMGMVHLASIQTIVLLGPMNAILKRLVD